MRPKLFAFDLDGTLIKKQRKDIQIDVLNEIKRLQRDGNKVGIITGRNYNQFRNLNIQFDYDFLSLINGAYIEIKDTPLKENKFTDGEVNYILNLINEQNFSYGVSTLEFVEVLKVDGNIETAMKIFDLPQPKQVKEIDTTNIYQIMIYEAHEDLLELRDILDDKYDIHLSDKFGMDICKKNISKGAALIEISEYYHIKSEDTIAFGDGENDRSLIMNAGHGVAMYDAAESLKKLSNEVCSSVNEIGVIDVLKRY